jgi:hypothetical protein
METAEEAGEGGSEEKPPGEEATEAKGEATAGEEKPPGED